MMAKLCLAVFWTGNSHGLIRRPGPRGPSSTLVPCQSLGRVPERCRSRAHERRCSFVTACLAFPPTWSSAGGAFSPAQDSEEGDRLISSKVSQRIHWRLARTGHSSAGFPSALGDGGLSGGEPCRRGHRRARAKRSSLPGPTWPTPRVGSTTFDQMAKTIAGPLAGQNCDADARCRRDESPHLWSTGERHSKRPRAAWGPEGLYRCQERQVARIRLESAVMVTRDHSAAFFGRSFSAGLGPESPRRRHRCPRGEPLLCHPARVRASSSPGRRRR